MALAPQKVYIDQANQIASLWNQFIGWYGAVVRINQLINKNGAQNVWKAMATSAQLADASLGTADGTPNEAHIITALGMTADDIINALNDMTALSQVFDGTGGNGVMTGAIDHRGDAPSVTTLTG